MDTRLKSGLVSLAQALRAKKIATQALHDASRDWSKSPGSVIAKTKLDMAKSELARAEFHFETEAMVVVSRSAEIEIQELA